jgi:3-deoxy-D-manno-octulosonate 8-phosphate phosphatase KdsC-like HAD superfamily phosphatase
LLRNARRSEKAFHTHKSRGWRRAVREIAEILLQAQGHWDGLLKKYEVE